jgi:antitoxin MazE
MSKKPFEISRDQNGGPSKTVTPKNPFKQLGFEKEAARFIDARPGTLNKRVPTCRHNWHLSSIAIAKAGEDRLVIGEFTNDADSSLTW